MYIQGRFSGADELCCKQDDYARGCDELGPAGRFICTREEGHVGVHRASIDTGRWVAEWDDDRSTDTDKTEFFTSIGL